jgi:hypothetical protein
MSTRTRSSGIRKASASSPRTPKGRWVPVQTVRLSLSHFANAARGSRGRVRCKTPYRFVAYAARKKQRLHPHCRRHSGRRPRKGRCRRRPIQLTRFFGLKYEWPIVWKMCKMRHVDSLRRVKKHDCTFPALTRTNKPATSREPCLASNRLSTDRAVVAQRRQSQAPHQKANLTNCEKP